MVQNAGPRRSTTLQIEEAGCEHTPKIAGVYTTRVETRTSIKHGQKEPQGRSAERNSTHSYKDTFTPTRSPNRHDKVQTAITDYIRDETPEWYAEVDRIAAMVEEKAMSVRKKRDQTESQNAHVNPQRQLTHQALMG